MSINKRKNGKGEYYQYKDSTPHYYKTNNIVSETNALNKAKTEEKIDIIGKIK